MPAGLAAAYANVEKALSKLDFKAFAAHFDSSFVLIDPAGKSTSRAQFLSEIKPVFEGFQSATSTTKIKSVHVMGDHAVVSYELSISIKGKPGTIRIREIGTESLMLKNGKWVLYRTVQEKFSYEGP